MENIKDALRYLGKEFHCLEKEKELQNQETMNLQEKIRELEKEKEIQIKVYQSLLVRVKMLEYALQEERMKYMQSNLVKYKYYMGIEKSGERVSQWDSSGKTRGEEEKTTREENKKNKNQGEKHEIITKVEEKIGEEIRMNRIKAGIATEIKKEEEEKEKEKEKEKSASTSERKSGNADIRTNESNTPIIRHKSMDNNSSTKTMKAVGHHSININSAMTNTMEMTNNNTGTIRITNSKTTQVVRTMNNEQIEKKNQEEIMVPNRPIKDTIEETNGIELERKSSNESETTIHTIASNMQEVQIKRRMTVENSETLETKPPSLPIQIEVTTTSKSGTIPTTEPILDKNSSYLPCKLKVKLTGHLDAVRKLCFHPTEPYLISASEDCTLKIWNLNTTKRGPDVDSIRTLRAHEDSVLALTAIYSNEIRSFKSSYSYGICASAGKDGNIMLWQLPSTSTDPKGCDTFEELQNLQIAAKLDAHTDAIWDLTSHPISPYLFSAGADGHVNLWNLTGTDEEIILKSQLVCYNQENRQEEGYYIPTSVLPVLTDLKTCVIGYTNGCLAHFDYINERKLQTFDNLAIELLSPSRKAQINQIINHPNMPLVLAAHQDNKIRMYDLRIGKCVETINAHQSAVSSISIDPSGLYFATGSHDGSLRVWSMNERSCVQEHSAHRRKYSESIHTLSYHPTKGYLSSGAADSLIKIFQ